MVLKKLFSDVFSVELNNSSNSHIEAVFVFEVGNNFIACMNKEGKGERERERKKMRERDREKKGFYWDSEFFISKYKF